MSKLIGLIAGLLLTVAGAFAQSEADLLPVEQAFALTAKAAEPGKVSLHWTIADGYYLYRSRIKAKAGDGATLGEIALPDGEKKHDEFLGDVEVYHHTLDATVPYTLADAAARTVALTVTVQGCHEREPKICYPPHPTKLSLPISSPSPVGAAEAATATSANTDAKPNAAVAGASSALAMKFGGAPSVAGAGEALPLPPEQAFVFEAIATAPGEILARWTMPKGYYLYRDKTQLTVSGPGTELGAPRWPKGVQHNDEHFGSTEVYFDSVELPLPIKRADGHAVNATLDAEFQGCQDNGVCYPVMARTIPVTLTAASIAELAAANSAFVAASASPVGAAEAATDPSAKPTTGSSPAASDQSEEQALAAKLGGNRLLALLSFFGFGLLLAFTPCVFPMIPILSGIIAGAGENVSTARAFVLSLVYVLASSVVFTIAGIAAGLAGANLQAAFQKPWILWSFAGLFVLLSLSMFGFYELQLPSSWQSKIADVSNKQKSGSLLGVAVMGVLSALIVGPCVAPPLAAAVLYISQTRDPVFGGLALFALSLGMGAPLVGFGTAAGRWLPRAGGWMDAVKAVFGVVFLGLAIWMLSRTLDAVWVMVLIAALAIASAVYLGALDRLPENASGWRKLWKALGVVLLLVGAAELIGASAGGRDVLQPLHGIVGASNGGGEAAGPAFKTIKSSADLDREIAQAKSANKRVLLDFYADWCVSCKEMDKFTFSKADVRAALGDFVLLRADVTANDEADQALLTRFGLFGPPATIFFGRDGVERRALRLIGYEAPEGFVARVAKAN